MKPPLLAVLALCSAASAASAQSPSPAVTQAPAEVRYRTTSVVDMGSIDVVGTVQGPSIWRVHQRKKPTFRSLIELRSDFHAELATSTAGL